jgi:hypothetical protein
MNTDPKLIYLLRFHGDSTIYSGDDILGTYENRDNAVKKLNEKFLQLDISNGVNGISSLYDLIFGRLSWCYQVEMILREEIGLSELIVDSILKNLVNAKGFTKLDKCNKFGIYQLDVDLINNSEIIQITVNPDNILEEIFRLYDNYRLSDTRRILINGKIMAVWSRCRLFMIDMMLTDIISIWMKAPYKFDLERNVEEDRKLNHYINCYEIIPCYVDD